MTIQPRTQEEIYTDLESNVTGAIPELTDWSPRTPNYVLVHDGYSSEIETLETIALAVQLSGWIDYAGGPVTESDLTPLGIDTSKIDIDLLNAYMDDEDLDELVVQNGVTRDTGSKATGTVTVTVNTTSTTVPKGTEFATEPDLDGDYYSFETTEDATPSSGTTVDVTVEAVDVGSEFNVGSGTVTYMPSPPPGIQSVTNDSAFSGGEDAETNDELRERAKSALAEKSEGGTVDGIVGGLVNRHEDVQQNDVEVIQFFDPSTPDDKQDSPYGDVYVDSAAGDTELQNDIDELKPAAIRHYLERPAEFDVNVTATVETSGTIDTTVVEDEITEYFASLGIGDDAYRDRIIQRIMNADGDIDNIASLTIAIVGDYTFQSGTDVYKLDKGDQMENDGITNVDGTLSSSNHTFVEDTDYQEAVTDGSDDDSIDWSLAGDNPDDGTVFTVTYNLENDLTIANTEKAVSNTVSVSIQ